MEGLFEATNTLDKQGGASLFLPFTSVLAIIDMDYHNARGVALVFRYLKTKRRCHQACRLMSGFTR